ncbi:haloacid dehalogenase, type II [Aspergillus ibericus CBS 121593]|uniref:Haloacid dehalogenase, type II n=1 Tax=Aspergillus ibericus CBS 121593 TaxID=1448316 RepID=A0A395HH02_9EURO|nr:haloacid dehalogenase, type II [Aspergillus ibericus CBS 121593]RAL06248.1 haloacid dehalogenase, type II [Aspergillus ibericus CBS 121593]
MSINPLPKVLFFDVFGTVVEWRSCVTRALMKAATRALLDSEKQLSVDVRIRAEAMTTEDWQAIAVEWRASYGHFTASFDPSSAFVSVDEHHYTYIQKLLQQRGLGGLFTDKERWDIALCWHRLEPWSDTVEGLRLLNRQFRTCTLSNGNVALLEDLRDYGSLPFTDVASAEHFGAYKPSPQVYHGAAKRFGLEPSECGMVAAHLYDLKAAKALGFMTIYVERPQEENLSAEQAAEAREEGFVDQWFGLGCGGLVEVAKRFGIPTQMSS